MGKISSIFVNSSFALMVVSNLALFIVIAAAWSIDLNPFLLYLTIIQSFNFMSFAFLYSKVIGGKL